MLIHDIWQTICISTFTLNDTFINYANISRLSLKILKFNHPKDIFLSDRIVMNMNCAAMHLELKVCRRVFRSGSVLQLKVYLFNCEVTMVSFYILHNYIRILLVCGIHYSDIPISQLAYLQVQGQPANNCFATSTNCDTNFFSQKVGVRWQRRSVWWTEQWQTVRCLSLDYLLLTKVKISGLKHKF